MPLGSVPMFAVLASSVGFVELSDDEDVADSRGDRGGEVDGPELLEELARAAELVEQLQVLEEGGLGVDREPDDLAARLGAHDPGLLGAQWGDVEGLADALATFHLSEEHPRGRSRLA